MADQQEAQSAPDPAKTYAEDTRKDDDQATAMNVDDATVVEGRVFEKDTHQQWYEQMLEMGVAENRAKRAVHFSGYTGLEGALEWLEEHQEDENIDDEFTPPPRMTQEEQVAHIEELRERARKRRDEEQRKLEAHQERERIRTGKEMLEAKKKEEEYALKRNSEQRQREKQEHDKAMQEMRKKLEEDRLERRRRLGLPEELTEEEKLEEEQRRKQKEEEDKKRLFRTVVPVTMFNKLRELLVDMKRQLDSSGQPAMFTTACETLTKYIRNIGANPEEPKFRRIRLGNAAFQQRVAAAPNGRAFLETIGFAVTEDGQFLELPRDKADLQALQGALGELNSAQTNPFFGKL